ncbi:SMR family transporter [Phyllobacterium sp. 22229]|uniref:SMR family transporter n=1 Tax=Phyllobacterium sp. 22229 TaxID=3453895 RepID=UPI003F85200D
MTGRAQGKTGPVYVVLALSVLGEVIGTTALAQSVTLTRIVPAVIAILSYVVAFWLLSKPLKVLNVGVVYAIWSGTGIILISATNWLVFDQRLDSASVIGMVFILVGVLIVNLFSRTLYR